jgi:predicted nucleic acid-binding protein
LLFFVDSCYLIALHDPNENNNGVAQDIEQALQKYKLVKDKKNLFLTNSVLAEVMNHILKKKQLVDAKRIYQDIASNYSLIFPSMKLTQEGFEDVCCRYWRGNRGHTLGLTDGVIVAVMRKKKIGLLLSFDGAFDAIVGIRRVSSIDEIKNICRIH